MLIYQQWKHSCFLYLGSIIVDEFGLVASCQPGLVTMVHVSKLYSDCSIRYENNKCYECMYCAFCAYIHVCCAFACLCVWEKERGEGNCWYRNYIMWYIYCRNILKQCFCSLAHRLDSLITLIQWTTISD